ncbi:hypothetical protein REPUB_Repub16aG0114500 [Reevesia pubescens]
MEGDGLEVEESKDLDRMQKDENGTVILENSVYQRDQNCQDDVNACSNSACGAQFNCWFLGKSWALQEGCRLHFSGTAQRCSISPTVLGADFISSSQAYNVPFQGWLGGSLKRKYVLTLVRKEKADVLFLQETKLVSVDAKLCSKLWDSKSFDWVAKNSDGRSGGLLCIWNSLVFEKLDFFEVEHFIGVDGFWRKERKRSLLVNVYARVIELQEDVYGMSYQL